MLQCRRAQLRGPEGLEGSDGATWDDLLNLQLRQFRDTSCSSRAETWELCQEVAREREEVAQSTDFVLDFDACRPLSF